MKIIITVFLAIITIGHQYTFSQKIAHNIYAKTAYNKIGFYNELGYQYRLKHNNLSLGLKHYTLDYLFEKNTLGIALAYGYEISSTSTKFYFSPGIRISIFKERKTNLDMLVTDINLVNTFGFRLTRKFSINYHLGFGAIKATSKNNTNNYKAEYFNYEMALGFKYSFK